MGRQVAPPKRVTSPTWGPPHPCKQALILHAVAFHLIGLSCMWQIPMIGLIWWLLFLI